MVAFETAAAGLFSFVSVDVIPAMPNGPRKFAAYMALGALRQDPESALAPYSAFLKMSGILSADGREIDEARLETALAEAFANMSTVEFLGFTFTEQDAARLVRRVAKGG